MKKRIRFVAPGWYARDRLGTYRVIEGSVASEERAQETADRLGMTDIQIVLSLSKRWKNVI